MTATANVGNNVVPRPVPRSVEDILAVFAEIDRIMAGEEFLPGLLAGDPPVRPDERKLFEE